MALSLASTILLLFPVFAFFCLPGIRDDALPARRWLLKWSTLLGMVALGILNAAKENRPTTGFVRWQRVLLRGLMLLAVGCRAVMCFVAFDYAVDMFVFLRGDGNSSAVASSACAVVAVALNLPLVWIFVFPGLGFMVDRSASSHPIDLQS